MVIIMWMHAWKTIQFLAGGAALLAVAGCSASSKETSRDAADGQTSMAILLRDRETALASLRAEIAAARIEAAKKEAELLELREVITQLRKDNAASRQIILDQRQTAEVTEAELKQLRTERDQLKLAQNEPAILRPENPVLRETVLMLSKEVEQLKKGRSQTPVSTAEKPAVKADLSPAALLVRPNVPSQDADDHRVVVQRGDTLLALARRYRTTLASIVEANALQSDRLEVGQTLSIPKPIGSIP